MLSCVYFLRAMPRCVTCLQVELLGECQRPTLVASPKIKALLADISTWPLHMRE
jgi:hypothetical protein